MVHADVGQAARLRFRTVDVRVAVDVGEVRNAGHGERGDANTQDAHEDLGACPVHHLPSRKNRLTLDANATPPTMKNPLAWFAAVWVWEMVFSTDFELAAATELS